MSFAPNPRYGTGLSPVFRTVLFWALMVALAVVLWRMVSVPKSSGPANQISYSNFLQQVDNNNIGTATFALSQNTAVVSGELRQPSQEYRTTVPKESVSDLTDRLRKQGANVDISESPKQTWQSYLINLAPLVFLVGFWIFMMNRMRGRQTFPPGSGGPPPTPSVSPSNTPL